MPIYEYECPQCGFFDAIQKAGDKPLKSKPDCDCADCPKKAKRVMSAPAFHLKGSGWYKTDYASSGSTSESSGKNKKKKESESSTSEKSESKDTTTKSTTKCGSGCGCH